MLKLIFIIMWILFLVIGAIGSIGTAITEVIEGEKNIIDAFREHTKKLLVVEVIISVMVWTVYWIMQ
ncbi:hypothetical protein [uncultured Tyzzerella sp.]|uniref:hypothetical protein n=1 Tax=uncultured Tyzzerella sp. TaxID=2321398 RepID=UPI0029429877|nr:hypothetical protein [uncultured Tyzzerella sp.]